MQRLKSGRTRPSLYFLISCRTLSHLGDTHATCQSYFCNNSGLLLVETQTAKEGEGTLTHVRFFAHPDRTKTALAAALSLLVIVLQPKTLPGP